MYLIDSFCLRITCKQNIFYLSSDLCSYTQTSGNNYTIMFQPSILNNNSIRGEGFSVIVKHNTVYDGDKITTSQHFTKKQKFLTERTLAT